MKLQSLAISANPGWKSSSCVSYTQQQWWWWWWQRTLTAKYIAVVTTSQLLRRHKLFSLLCIFSTQTLASEFLTRENNRTTKSYRKGIIINLKKESISFQISLQRTYASLTSSSPSLLLELPSQKKTEIYFFDLYQKIEAVDSVLSWDCTVVFLLARALHHSFLTPRAAEMGEDPQIRAKFLLCWALIINPRHRANHEINGTTAKWFHSKCVQFHRLYLQGAPALFLLLYLSLPQYRIQWKKISLDHGALIDFPATPTTLGSFKPTNSHCK